MTSFWPRNTCLVNEGQAVSLQDRIPTVPLWPQGAGIEEYYHPSETDCPDLWEHALWAEATLFCLLLRDTDIAATFAGKGDTVLSLSHTSQLFPGLLLSTKTALWASCVHWECSCLCKPLHRTFATWLPRRGGRVSSPFWCSCSTRRRGSFVQLPFITKDLCSRGQLLNSTKDPWLQRRADGMPKGGGGGGQCKLAFLCSFI